MATAIINTVAEATTNTASWSLLIVSDAVVSNVVDYMDDWRSDEDANDNGDCIAKFV